MIRRLRASAYFALALREYRNNNIGKARIYIEKNISLAKTKSATALAFRATLMLLDRDISSARQEFLDAINVITDRGSDAEYVMMYCRYYICLIEEGSGCDELRKAALAIPASRNMKEWLSLPDEAVRI